MKYDRILIYTKKGNLMSYLTTDKVACSFRNANAERLTAYYGREREIQLIACIRWEERRCFCKIKCPVNPLPVKGEFEVPSLYSLRNFLKANGWEQKHDMYSGWFE